MNKPRLIRFDKIGSPNLGFISVAEISDNVPFSIKRVYWTYFTPNHVVRGHHAHRKLQQVIVAVSGVIDFELEDTAGEVLRFTLDEPSVGLFIPEGYWRTIRFSHSAVLLCMASQEYDEADYIRDLQEFKNSTL